LLARLDGDVLVPGSGGDRDVCVWPPSRVTGGGTISCGVLESEPSPTSDPDRIVCVVGTNGKLNDGVAVDPSADGAGCGEDPKNSRGRSSSPEPVELLRWGFPSWPGSLSLSLIEESGLNGSAVCSSDDVESSVSSSSDKEGLLG
jgi:hypothetical protein